MRAVRLFLLFAFVSLLTRWLSLVIDVIDMDETAHVVGAWELLRGRVPYAEFVNNKPPLLYVYYALSQWLIGEGLWSVRLLTILTTLPLTALALAWSHAWSRTGVVAGGVFLVYSAAFLGHDMLAVNTEILMLLPASWAMAMVATPERASRGRYVAAAGVLVGVAALFRPQGLLFGPPIGIAAAWNASTSGRGALGTRQCALLALGIAVPLAATWAVFAWLGAADDLVYWVFANNIGYALNPISTAEALERMVSYFVPWLIVTAPLWYAAVPLLASEAGSYRVVLGAWTAVFALPAAIVGFRFYPHYFIQMYLPLAWLSAPVVEGWLRRPLSRAGKAVVWWSVAMLVLAAASTMVLYSGRVRVYREIDPVFARVGTRLRTDPCAGGSLFVWGYAPVFYYHARMPAASRFVVMAQARLTGYVSGNRTVERGDGEAAGVVVPAHWDWLMDDLERRRATFIVDAAPAGIFRWNQFPLRGAPRLQAYVDEHFTLVDTIDRVRIYRRVGCEAGR